MGAGRQNYHRAAPIKSREASVTVKSDWIVVEEMDFPRLGKLSLPTVNEPIDLLQCGSLEFYDKIYDRVNVKNEKPLQRIDRIFHTVTTTDDPVIRKLVKSEPNANVFVTDAILATLMCAGRSAYSWDIVVQKIGGKVFLDKRDNLKFGYVTRYNVKDSSRHVILGTQQFKPIEFGQQINLSMANAWGIVRCVLDLVMAQKDGKYLIVKDPNKAMIRLYDIPDNTFESEEDSDESEEGISEGE